MRTILMIDIFYDYFKMRHNFKKTYATPKNPLQPKITEPSPEVSSLSTGSKNHFKTGVMSSKTFFPSETAHRDYRSGSPCENLSWRLFLISFIANERIANERFFMERAP